MTELMDYDEAARRFDPVLGIEVHVELGTATKMFDAAPNAFGGDPNTYVTPVSLGLPGSCRSSTTRPSSTPSRSAWP